MNAIQKTEPITTGSPSVVYAVAVGGGTLIGRDGIEFVAIGAILLLAAGLIRLSIIRLEKTCGKTTTSYEVAKGKVTPEKEEVHSTVTTTPKEKLEGIPAGS